MQGQYIKCQNAKNTLILLHGWCCSPQDFQSQIQYFKENYSILIPDYSKTIINHKTKSDNIFTTCLMELKSYIESYNLKDFVLIGHSMGGVFAIALTQYFKNISYVIIDTTLIVSDIFYNFIKQLRDDSTNTTIVNLIDNRWIHNTTDNLILMEQKKTEVLAIWKQSSDNFIDILDEAMQFDKIHAIRCFNGEILYIASQTTNITELDAIMQHKMPIQQIQSGHFIMLNAPEQLNGILNSFLNNK